MHTATLTQRFGVPALVAATFHVVLLFAFGPSMPDLVIRPPEEKIILRPIPTDLFTPPAPPATAVDSNAPVKPLNPGPVRPTSEDRSSARETEISVNAPPIAAPPHVPVTDGKIPSLWGDGTPGQPTLVESGGPGIFSPAQLDRLPSAKVQPAPEYPFALRQAGIEGNVTVEFDVDASGRVVSARAVNSTNREFEDAALRAVLMWRFEPGRRHGKAVPFRMIVPVGFAVTEQ